MSLTHARYKINGKFVYMPKKSPEEQRAYRLEYNKQWKKDNPQLVKASKKRYEDYKRRNNA